MIDLPNVNTEQTQNHFTKLAKSQGNKSVREITNKADEYAQIAKDLGVESSWVDSLLVMIFGFFKQVTASLGLAEPQMPNALAQNNSGNRNQPQPNGNEQSGNLPSPQTPQQQAGIATRSRGS